MPPHAGYSPLAALDSKRYRRSFQFGVAPSGQVGKTDAPGTVSSITLSIARGNMDTQVIVQGPACWLDHVNVTASALPVPAVPVSPVAAHPGPRVNYLNVTVHRELRRRRKSPSGFRVTYPEPLIPFNDPEAELPLCVTGATLKACNATRLLRDRINPYWIDISVPRGPTEHPTRNLTRPHLDYIRSGQ